jgi:hypothetical protein
MTHFPNKMLWVSPIADKLRAMALEPLETAEAQGVPTVRQQSVFVENRVGQLLRLTQLFDRTEVRILAMSVVHAVDCAICRLLMDDPDKAQEILSYARFPVSETELLAISLPHGRRGLLATWSCLLRAEVNIHYTYPLLIRPRNAAALALCPDNLELAASVLREQRFELLDQQALMDARGE